MVLPPVHQARLLLGGDVGVVGENPNAVGVGAVFSDRVGDGECECPVCILPGTRCRIMSPEGDALWWFGEAS